jgi:hypothetical protein
LGILQKQEDAYSEEIDISLEKVSSISRIARMGIINILKKGMESLAKLLQVYQPSLSPNSGRQEVYISKVQSNQNDNLIVKIVKY